MLPSFQESSFMRISKELIEKYHDGDCTPEEKKAVEDWLFSDEAGNELVLPPTESKSKIRDEMWDEISTVLPNKKTPLQTIFLKPYWRQAAAVLLVGMMGPALFYLKYAVRKSEIIVINNSSETINKDLNEQEYTISVGPKSNVEINNNTGNIDFCGAMMINPKRDIELSIHGTCQNKDEKSEKMKLKKGQNYIALNYSNPAKSDEIIILQEGSLAGLPPIMQRQLMIQFDI